VSDHSSARAAGKGGRTASGGAPTAAIGAVVDAGVTYRLHRYEHDPAAPSYGGEAATVLGVDPARVHKTLVAAVSAASGSRPVAASALGPAVGSGPGAGTASGELLVVAVVPVAGQLDLKALAAACGGRKAVMAEAAAAERATGYVVGGISPLGHRRRLQVIVDEAALGWETVFVSAGRRGLELELAPADLVRLAGASLAAIGR
jgi:Cys-tRNA(Pro)/Cys-tRNA(Cys) deacylase